ncbi:aromatic-ring-hydroxylating dioxygenase subunit beta [Alteromonas lipolytica]|uniref:Aromatic-ring-hydroxylating dioxygenase subunit beta n=1 Tax=Alteromonas lipolytica TaxID=1856405 RepID=A0A1E8FAS2_9ALTE|nr:aromatic-ring-hydroxylating dioxygenase subunit beta [Alteromonas lipolytica]OFI33010.1 hypothetical protein BFC17_01680 [Alteromonas lipolytica]GGF63354.1 aromatic-ring-hydroxylating dioxygenase subunit beta [Alteromonas lipolytica]
MSENQLYTRVSEFLSLEADLLDHKAYDEWLALWEKSGLYIVPVEHDVTDFANHLNVAYDDDEMRQLRIARLSNGEAVSTVGAENTVRTLSRIRILEASDELVTVRCAYCLYENNKNGVRAFPANVEFILKPTEDSFLIQQKVARVMKSNEHLTTVSYLF